MNSAFRASLCLALVLGALACNKGDRPTAVPVDADGSRSLPEATASKTTPTSDSPVEVAPLELPSNSERGSEPERADTTGAPLNGGDAAAFVQEEPPSAKTRAKPAVAADPVAAIVEQILREVTTGNLGPDDREAIEKRLLEVLEQQRMGTPEERARAVSMQANMMLEKQREMGSRPATGGALQEQALRVLASEIANDFYRKLPIGGGGSRHEGTLLATARSIELPSGYEQAPWAVLGGFDYREGMQLPPHITAFNDKKVGMSGYMIALDEVEDIHEFLLVESLWSCCFGVPPETHQVILVRVPGKRGADFTTSPILVLGRLEVGEQYQDGFVTSLYRIETDKVKEID